jgi:hypothetical protein
LVDQSRTLLRCFQLTLIIGAPADRHRLSKVLRKLVVHRSLRLLTSPPLWYSEHLFEFPAVPAHWPPPGLRQGVLTPKEFELDFSEFQTIVVLGALLLVSSLANAANVNARTWLHGKILLQRQEWGRR